MPPILGLVEGTGITDLIKGIFGAGGARTYLPDSMVAAHLYISPMDHPFKSKAPLWIQTGGLEVLYDMTMKSSWQII